jgi:pilus assembly protein Flp/PilA
MQQLLRRFIMNNDGATAIEYGMIAALISVAIIGSLRVVGTSLSAKFTAITAALNQ